MKHPKRKLMRLKDYDYSQNGAYFITICTHNRQELFEMSTVGNADLGVPQKLTETGDIMEHPKRKLMRLKDYDYSQNGAYFITICTKNKQPILCEIVGRDDLGTPNCIIKLTEYGNIVNKYINSISNHYENIFIDKYTIMPDHIHILMSITNGAPGSSDGAPGSSHPTVDIPKIVGVLKRLINKEVGENIFQTSYYDHIIRDENDYLAKWNYIENNPLKRIVGNADPGVPQ